MPTVDLTQPVARYFEYVQKSVDFNRDLATRWAELVTSLSGTVREQAEKVTGIVKDQTNTVADLAVQQAQKAEDVAQRAGRSGRGGQEGAGAAGQGRRAGRGQQAKEQAREPYEGLTKAELSDLLARAGLAEVGHRRGTHRATGQRRQRVTRTSVQLDAGVGSPRCRPASFRFTARPPVGFRPHPGIRPERGAWVWRPLPRTGGTSMSATRPCLPDRPP